MAIIFNQAIMGGLDVIPTQETNERFTADGNRRITASGDVRITTG